MAISTPLYQVDMPVLVFWQIWYLPATVFRILGSTSVEVTR